LFLLAACVTNTAATPDTITCDLGANTVWNAGDTVEITVPVVAGLAAAINAVNTAVITDDKNRTSQDTFPVTINVDPTVGAAVLLFALLVAASAAYTLLQSTVHSTPRRALRHRSPFT
jgi:hypothetical protein